MNAKPLFEPLLQGLIWNLPISPAFGDGIRSLVGYPGYLTGPYYTI